MCRQLVVLTFLTAAYSVYSQQTSTDKNTELQIYGGSLATIGDHPYQASLQYDRIHICSSAIISSEWAITVAQCFSRDYLNLYTVKTGSAQLGQGEGVGVHLLASVAVHPLYSPQTLNYDIALFKVATPFVFGAGLAAIPLPETGRKTPSGFKGTISGWVRRETGKEFVDQLQKASLEVITRDECQKPYQGVGEITEEKICAGVTGCLSDAGAPLVIENTLIGVASWNQLCTDVSYPTVFSRVASVRDWIDENVPPAARKPASGAVSATMLNSLLFCTTLLATLVHV